MYMLFKKLLFSAVLLVIMLLPVNAATYKSTDIFFELKDVSSDENLPDIPVFIKIVEQNKGTEIELTEYISNGMLDYTISPGDWTIIFSADDPSTPEIDYFAAGKILVDGSKSQITKTIYLTPVGIIEGEVLDAANKLVNGADLEFKCSKELGLEYPKKTDKFGSFKTFLAPEGNCKIYATSKNLVGNNEVMVSKGNSSYVKILLEQPLTPKSKIYIYYIIGGVLLLMLVFLLFKFRKKLFRRKKIGKAKKKKPKEKKSVKIKGELNPRARDVMQTLNEKEKTIAEFLLKNKNKSTQAKIRNETGIPKTTLARTFSALEAKKVIEIERIGRLKKIRLTDWFLGNE